MLLAGDEFGRTQRGNNNAYCQDNEISWVDWSLAERNARSLPLHAAADPLPQGPPRRCGGAASSRTRRGPASAGTATKLGKPDWSKDARTLAMHILATRADEAIYLAANAHWEGAAFELPRLPPGLSWRRFADTSLPPGEDALEPGAEAPLVSQRSYPVGPRSVVVLVGR